MFKKLRLLWLFGIQFRINSEFTEFTTRWWFSRIKTSKKPCYEISHYRATKGPKIDLFSIKKYTSVNSPMTTLFMCMCQFWRGRVKKLHEDICKNCYYTLQNWLFLANTSQITQIVLYRNLVYRKLHIFCVGSDRHFPNMIVYNIRGIDIVKCLAILIIMSNCRKLESDSCKF